MSDALILSACRTPIGKFRGALASLSVADLGAHVVRAAVEQSGVDASDVDEVILGNVLTAGVGQAPARQTALKAGLPPTVAALTFNKVCGSGLKAAMLGAQAVRCGDASVIVAGGDTTGSCAVNACSVVHEVAGAVDGLRRASATTIDATRRSRSAHTSNAADISIATAGGNATVEAVVVASVCV